MAYKSSTIHFRNDIKAIVTGISGDDMAIKLEFRVTEWFGKDFNLAVDSWYFSVEEAQTIISELQSAITALNPPSQRKEPTSPTVVPAARVVVGSDGRELDDYDKHALDEISG